MKLYLVRGNEIEEFNTDLFVVAEDTDRAREIWNDYCVENSWARDEDDDSEDGTLPRTKTFDPHSARIVLDDVAGTKYAGAERAVGWNDLPIEWEA